MTARILDGQSRFGVDMQTFYRRPEIAVRTARRGVLIPPIADVAEGAEPALAFVDPLPDGTVRWIARCPDCLAAGRTGAEYVWLATPLMFCMRCVNGGIGNTWRPIAVPAERAEIERLLLARPDPETRVWRPGETPAQLAEENDRLGVG